MTIQLSFPDAPNYSAFYTLDGQEYNIQIRYNTRDTGWRVSISDNEEDMKTAIAWWGKQPESKNF